MRLERREKLKCAKPEMTLRHPNRDIKWALSLVFKEETVLEKINLRVSSV